MRRSTDLELVPLGSKIGVEVRGLDLADTAACDGAATTIVEAFERHHLLLFRQIDVSVDAHARLLAYLGPLMDELETGALFTYNSNVRDDSIVPLGKLLWHNDLAYTVSPIWAISLYALEIKGQGNPTKFVDMVRACERLPDEICRQAANHSATQIVDFSDSSRAELVSARELDLPFAPPRSEYPSVSHPVLMTHPRTRETLVFVNEFQTLQIDGLDRGASDRLLDLIFSHCYRDENVYRHDWQTGDLLVWDNLAVQHSRDEPVEEAGCIRTFRRMAVNDRTTSDLMAGTHHPTLSANA